ncbi:MAG: hypothetical protein AAB680_03670 [Pseudomonadota bacterium]
MDLQQLKNRIANSQPLEFCREELFLSQYVWLFVNKYGDSAEDKYREFKLAISRIININPTGIAIVGSSKFGYSLAPNKRFREYNDESDLDLVIVSTQLFSETFKQLRNAYFNGLRFVAKRHSHNYFCGFISIKDEDRPEYQSTYLRETVLMLKEMKTKVSDIFEIENKLNFRIYKTWDDAEKYHVFGTSQLKDSTNEY